MSLGLKLLELFGEDTLLLLSGLLEVSFVFVLFSAPAIVVVAVVVEMFLLPAMISLSCNLKLGLLQIKGRIWNRSCGCVSCENDYYDYNDMMHVCSISIIQQARRGRVYRRAGNMDNGWHRCVYSFNIHTYYVIVIIQYRTVCHSHAS